MNGSGIFTQQIFTCPACGNDINGRFSYDLALDKAVANMKFDPNKLRVAALAKVTGLQVAHDCLAKVTR